MRKTLIKLGCAGLAAAGVTGVLLLSPQESEARRFRHINPIATPQNIPDGAVRMKQRRPVDPELVRQAVLQLADAWNTGQLGDLLDRERFYDRSRLLDVIAEEVPRDAKLRVVSIGAVNTLDQYQQTERERLIQVSTVSALVRTQIEFTLPRFGYQKLDGTSEFTLEVRETLK
jgi:hypothetical protein